MMTDQDRLSEYLERLADKYTCAELVDILEDAGLITIWDILAAFEEQLMEGKEKLGF